MGAAFVIYIWINAKTDPLRSEVAGARFNVMGKLLTLCASGPIAFAFPRLLIAAGVPLLNWIDGAGVMLGAATDWVNPDIVLWTFTIFLAFALYGIEIWKHPARRAWKRLLELGQRDSNGIRAQAKYDRIIERDVWLYDAICYGLLRRWEKISINGDGPGIGKEKTDKLYDIAVKEIRQLAHDGNLPIWGKASKYEIWKGTGKVYWAENEVDWFSFIHCMRTTSGEHLASGPTVGNGQPHTQTELMTSKARVEELWPVENI